LKIDVLHLCFVLSKAGKVYKERIEKMGDKGKRDLKHQSFRLWV